jgi:histidinol phosphatase-like enzyme (inositol monophosphatase family)
LKQADAGGTTVVASAQISAADPYLDFAHELADLSARAILPHFRRSLAVHNKAGTSGFDPVTAADRAAERAVRKAIRARFPSHGIEGEELGRVVGKSRYRWLIDPIDGTRAFIIGSPLWGTLIGLMNGPAPVVGLMNQPFTGERFWSDARSTHMRNPDGKVRRLKTRRRRGLADAVLTTTHPDLFASPYELAGIGRLKGAVRMTRYGGDCYGYCLLAAGFVDIIVESGLKPYDILPLVPIIEAAGGVVTTWDGTPATEGGRIVACGDARVHKQALALLGGEGV